MVQPVYSISWRYDPRRGIGSQLFGMITTYCIAHNLKRNFFAQWKENSPLKLTYTIKMPYIKTKEILLLNDIEQMKYFEDPEFEAKIDKKNIELQTSQNLYQHFCYNRPQYEYKETLLYILSRSLTIFFNIPSYKYVDVRMAVGIHVQCDNPTKNNITDILVNCKLHLETYSPKDKLVFIVSKYTEAYEIATEIFEPEIKVYYDKRPQNEFIDLIHLSKCKALYIAWNSNFSRMGALLNPNRILFMYGHPKYSPDISECILDELMSYYKGSIKMKKE